MSHSFCIARICNSLPSAFSVSFCCRLVKTLPSVSKAEPNSAQYQFETSVEENSSEIVSFFDIVLTNTAETLRFALPRLLTE